MVVGENLETDGGMWEASRNTAGPPCLPYR